MNSDPTALYTEVLNQLRTAMRQEMVKNSKEMISKITDKPADLEQELADAEQHDSTGYAGGDIYFSPELMDQVPNEYTFYKLTSCELVGVDFKIGDDSETKSNGILQVAQETYNYNADTSTVLPTYVPTQTFNDATSANTFVPLPIGDEKRFEKEQVKHGLAISVGTPDNAGYTYLSKNITTDDNS